ncbi:MAG: hypothetical protein ACD_63C00254G0006 [uncultured bacterium]|nr:MAG: hypothetical protein ACD_63C00254G0006 [uncultured bacterium]
MPSKKQKLMLVDGNALIHRAFHALPATLRTKKGEIVNAVYGFTSIFLNALKKIDPDYVAVTFDLKKPTFRNELYEDYKAKRVKAPQELYDQIPRVKEVVKALNIPIYEKEGFEADDLLAVLNEKFKSAIGDARAETIIVSGDLDILQLVDDSTKVFALHKGLSDTVIYDEAAVKKRYGLKPEQLIDFKALAGDSSDNIPGVHGIGQKIAAELISEFGNLKNLYDNIESGKIKDSVRKKLISGKDNAILGKKLVTIVKNIPDIAIELKNCSVQNYDRGKVRDLFSELQFKSLLNKLPRASTKHRALSTKPGFSEVGKNKIERKCNIVDDERTFKMFLGILKKQKSFVFDVETETLDSITGRVVGVSFCWKKAESWYLANIDFLKKLKPIFQSPKIKKMGHNLKYDVEVLENCGIDVKGIFFDTMIASYLLDPGTRAHKLDQVAFAELGYEMQPIEELIGKGKKQLLFSQVPFKKAAEYSCEDSEITFRLAEILKKKLGDMATDQKKEKQFKVYERWDIKALYEKIENPLIEVLAQMERYGVLIDVDFLQKMSKEFEERIDKIRKSIFEIAEEEFNINSTKQLRKILFEKLKVSTEEIKKTKTGFSTAATELEKLRGKHEIIDHIFEYRELTKLKNTYLDALPKLVNKKTGRLHTNFNQTVTATGRLSSSNPNLQNIPIRTTDGERIRRAFVADRGYNLVSFDYSQIDLRVLAHFSEDAELVESFKNGEDVHTIVAADIFDVEPDRVTKEMRRVAKVVNFGIVYGMSSHGLSRNLKIERAKANLYIKKYFEKHPRVKDYMENIVEFARKHGYVETLFGRRRYLPEIVSSQFQVRGAAERMAINMPIQGTSSDIVKLAMVMVSKSLRDFGDKARMLLQVHDELLFEIKKDVIKSVVERCIEGMENVCELAVPLRVNVKRGRNWGDMKDEF